MGERNSGPRGLARTWGRAAAEAEKVWWERGELGFGRARVRRRRGFRVLRNAMAVDGLRSVGGGRAVCRGRRRGELLAPAVAGLLEEGGEGRAIGGW